MFSRSLIGPLLNGSGDVAPSIWCLRSLTAGALRGIILDRGTSSSFFVGVFDGNFTGDISFFLPLEAFGDSGLWVSGFGSEYFTLSISSSVGRTSPSHHRYISIDFVRLALVVRYRGPVSFDCCCVSGYRGGCVLLCCLRGPWLPG